MGKKLRDVARVVVVVVVEVDVDVDPTTWHDIYEIHPPFLFPLLPV